MYIYIYVYIIDMCVCVCVGVCIQIYIFSGAADYGRILTMVDLAGAIDEAGLYFCTKKASKLLNLLAFSYKISNTDETSDESAR